MEVQPSKWIYIEMFMIERLFKLDAYVSSSGIILPQVDYLTAEKRALSDANLPTGLTPFFQNAKYIIQPVDDQVRVSYEGVTTDDLVTFFKGYKKFYRTENNEFVYIDDTTIYRYTVSSSESGVVSFAATTTLIEDELEPFHIVSSNLGLPLIDEAGYHFTKPAGSKFVLTVKGYLQGSIFFDETFGEKPTESVRIIFDGVLIYAKDAPGISWAAEEKKLTIETTNSDNAIYSVSETGTYNAVESNNNIDVIGVGVLQVGSTSNHAIKGSDVAVYGSLKLVLFAAHDGINAKEISLHGGQIYIYATSDGLDAEKNSKQNKGDVFIFDNVEVIVLECENGIKAEHSIVFGEVEQVGVSVIALFPDSLPFLGVEEITNTAAPSQVLLFLNDLPVESFSELL
jgi:hypothetical protein